MTDRDPKCDHVDQVAGRVSSHDRQVPLNEAHASTYVCGRNECVLDAQEWVQEQTGIRGQFYALHTDLRRDRGRSASEVDGG